MKFKKLCLDNVDNIIKPFIGPSADEEPSEIRKFYKDSHIFITGGTGFMGCLLIEKLLRACPDLTRIYLLIREKKGKSPEQRLDEIFSGPIYEKLRKDHSNIINNKITLIIGDCEQPNLGLSLDDQLMLKSTINVVFHVAASVGFEDPLRKAAYINVRATKDLLLIAQDMSKLKAFIHISTAYSNCVQNQVDELFYELPITCDRLLRMCNVLSDDQLAVLLSDLLVNWPNTYTYTKAIAEHAIKVYGQNLPITIVRPSIVTSTYKEPIPGWINNLYGAVGIVAGVASGVLHTLHCNQDNIADLVPADYCINAIIAAGWQIGTTDKRLSAEIVSKKLENIKEENNIQIYNYVSSAENPITWRQFNNFCNTHGDNIGTTKAIWHRFFYMVGNYYLYFVLTMIWHIFPAILTDGGLRLIRRKPMFLKLYKKVHKFCTVIEYFSTTQWHFCNNNTQALWKKLNTTDQHLFEFDMKQLDWNAYLYCLIQFGRIYFLKDPLDTMPDGKAKQMKLKIIHYTVMFVFSVLFWKLLISV